MITAATIVIVAVSACSCGPVCGRYFFGWCIGNESSQMERWTDTALSNLGR